MTQKILLEVQLKSDDLDAGHAAVHETLEQTRAFAGAISLEVLVDDTDPTRLVVIETWETAADHDAYIAWRATPEGAPRALGAVVDDPPITRTFAPLSAL